MIQQMLAIWSLVPLPFLKPAWTSGSSQFTYCWSLAWRILSITLLACDVKALLGRRKLNCAPARSVTQSCPTLCDPMDCSPPGSSMGFSRQEHWSGLLFPSPRDLPDPGIELASPISPALQAESLGKPIHIHKRFCLCPPRVCFPVLYKFWRLYGGVAKLHSSHTLAK